MFVWDQIVDFLRVVIFAYVQACGGNLGSGILAASLAVRLVMFPLTLRIAKASFAHQPAMEKLKPELERIRKRFGDRPRRVAEESRRLFEREGVSPFPMTGCLGSLVQLPVFLAFYSAVRRCVVAGGRLLWIRNIARPDFVLALLVAAFTYLSVALATPPSQHGRAMLLLVPVVVSLIFLAQTSAGIALYWGVSAMVGLVQSWIVRRASPAAGAA